MAPDAMREHLLLNAAKITSFVTLEAEIENYLATHEAIAGDPMDVGEIRWTWARSAR